MTLPAAFAVDVSDRTEITATGADRVRILHGLCSNDVKALPTGQGCEAFLTTVQGKTLGHVLIFADAATILLDTVPGEWPRLERHLNKYVVTEDVTYTETSQQRSLWLLGGAEIGARLQAASGELPATYLSCRKIEFGGIPVTLTRVAMLGSDSFLLHAKREHAAEICRIWTELSLEVITPNDELTGMRIAAQWPLFGVDFHEDNLPQEVNRTDIAISFRKGCYLGQETIARLENLGHVNKLLSRVKIEGDALPTLGTELSLDGKVCGQISSAGWDPITQQPIAFAILRANAAKTGVKLTTTNGGAAEVL